MWMEIGRTHAEGSNLLVPGRRETTLLHASSRCVSDGRSGLLIVGSIMLSPLRCAGLCEGKAVSSRQDDLSCAQATAQGCEQVTQQRCWQRCNDGRQLGR